MQSEAVSTAEEAPPPDWTALVVRLTSGDARQALDQLRTSSVVAEGKVCLVGLDAIRERLGPRWAGRREMVYDHVQQTLRRQLGPHGFFLRISEVSFLVAQPTVSRLSGQAYCLNCLREILTYFLGEAVVADIVVHEVTSIGEGEIDARKLDVVHVEADAAAERASRPFGPKPPGPQDRWSPFVSQDGRWLRASCALEPVFQLKTFGRIGYRLTRRVLPGASERPLTAEEQRHLTGADIEKIDFATLARGLNRLQQDTDADRQPSLILPVSYVTLSSQRARPTLVEFFRTAQSSVQRGLICEVCDIEGVPPSALLAATSLIRPFSLFMVGRLAAAPSASLAHLKEVGLNGFSIERPAGAMSDTEFADFARLVTTATRPAARGVMFFGLTSAREVAIASLYGATHASFALGATHAQPAEARALEPA